MTGSPTSTTAIANRRVRPAFRRCIGLACSACWPFLPLAGQLLSGQESRPRRLSPPTVRITAAPEFTLRGETPEQPGETVEQREAPPQARAGEEHLSPSVPQTVSAETPRQAVSRAAPTAQSVWLTPASEHPVSPDSPDLEGRAERLGQQVRTPVVGLTDVQTASSSADAGEVAGGPPAPDDIPSPDTSHVRIVPGVSIANRGLWVPPSTSALPPVERTAPPNFSRWQDDDRQQIQAIEALPPVAVPGEEPIPEVRTSHAAEGFGPEPGSVSANMPHQVRSLARDIEDSPGRAELNRSVDAPVVLPFDRTKLATRLAPNRPEFQAAEGSGAGGTPAHSWALEVDGTRRLRLPQDVAAIQLSDSRICEVVLVNAREVVVIGRSAGTTTVRFAFDSSEPEQVHAVHIRQQGSGTASTMETTDQLAAVLNRKFPGRGIQLEWEREFLVVRGSAASQREAIEILSFVRDTYLVPVVDRLDAPRGRP